uniref:GIY-YIG endonuclease n=1 Tax=Chrysoporthe austroafricana TaxID=354353 RepID=A0A191MWP6_9PEZI|nr:GIY-YIG endonuclease [Chrysoporthe austroafricana]AMX22090.1 GIY-YIG endonuclease [Chrysoporthe austroafricana]
MKKLLSTYLLYFKFYIINKIPAKISLLTCDFILFIFFELAYYIWPFALLWQVTIRIAAKVCPIAFINFSLFVPLANNSSMFYRNLSSLDQAKIKSLVSVRYYGTISIVPKSDWKKDLQDQYRKHNIILKHLKEYKGPSLEILKEVLCFPQPSFITEAHLALIKKLYEERVILPLPLVGTKESMKFSELVGPTHYSTKNKLNGCYIITGLNFSISPITGIKSLDSYVGQSVHLVNRIKIHARGSDPATGAFVKSLRDKGKVELVIIRDDTVIPEGLSKGQFITLLEQYLIIKLKPTVNRKLIVTPGILWTPEVTQKHIDKLSSQVYVYRKEEDNMILVQKFPTTRAVGLSVGKGKSFYSNLVARSQGWYKDLFLFTTQELEGAEHNILSVSEFLDLIEEAGSIKKGGFSVRVTDILSGEVKIYNSMREVTREIGIDNKGIKDKAADSSKLYKKKYKIEIV